jgi:hypothetical protein
MDMTSCDNMMHLNDWFLPYSLSLFNESMNDKADLSNIVMTQAWYGVTSIRN